MTPQVPSAPPSPEGNIWEVRLSSLRYPCLTASVEIGLIKAMSTPKTIPALAKQLGCSELAIEVLIRTLWADGFIEKMGKDGFMLTPPARQHLLAESPYFWGSVFQTSGERSDHDRVISAIKKDGERIKHGEKSYTEMWEAGQIDEESARIFTERMHAYIFAPAIAAVNAGVFEGVSHLLDAGGGAGSFGIALAQKYPKIKTTLLDLAPVCKVARESFVAKYGVLANFNFHSGNFFEEYPRGHDAVLFSNVFHDWRRRHCETLAQRAFECLGQGGRIFIHEMILDEDKRPPIAAAGFGLLMFLNHSGKQYTHQELKEILTGAGFRDFQVQQTYGSYSMASARKA